MRKGFLNAPKSASSHGREPVTSAASTPHEPSTSSISAPTASNDTAVTDAHSSLPSVPREGNERGSNGGENGSGTQMVEIEIPGNQKRRARIPYHVYLSALQQAGGDQEKAIKSLQLHVLKSLQQRQQQTASQTPGTLRNPEPQGAVHEGSRTGSTGANDSQLPYTNAGASSGNIGHANGQQPAKTYIDSSMSIQDILRLGCQATVTLQDYLPFTPLRNNRRMTNARSTSTVDTGSSDEGKTSSGAEEVPNLFRECGEITIPYSFCAFTMCIDLSCIPFPCTHIFALEKLTSDGAESVSSNESFLLSNQMDRASAKDIHRIKSPAALQKFVLLSQLKYEVSTDSRCESIQTFCVKPGMRYRLKWFVGMTKGTKSGLFSLVGSDPLEDLLQERRENGVIKETAVCGRRVHSDAQGVYYDLSSMVALRGCGASNSSFCLPPDMTCLPGEVWAQCKRIFHRTSHISLSTWGAAFPHILVKVYLLNNPTEEHLHTIKHASLASEKVLSSLRSSWLVTGSSEVLLGQLKESVGTAEKEAASVTKPSYLWDNCVSKSTLNELFSAMSFHSQQMFSPGEIEDSTIVLNNLQPGSKYVAKLFVSSDGKEYRVSYARPLVFETLAAPPSVPEAPTITNIGTRSVKFEFLGEGSVDYVVQYREVMDTNDLLNSAWNEQWVDSSSLSVSSGCISTVENLQPDTDYEIRLIGFNSVGRSSPSGAVSIHTKASPPPTPSSPSIEQLETYHISPDAKKSSFKIPKAAGRLNWEFSIAQPAKLENSLRFIVHYKKLPKSVAELNDTDKIYDAISNAHPSAISGKTYSITEIRGFSYAFRGFDTNCWYAFRVVAQNHAGNSKPTPWTVVKMPLAAPPSIVHFDVEFDSKGTKTEAGLTLYTLCHAKLRFQLPRVSLPGTSIEVEFKLDEEVVPEWQVFGGKRMLSSPKAATIPSSDLPSNLRQVSMVSLDGRPNWMHIEQAINEMQNNIIDREVRKDHQLSTYTPGNHVEVLYEDQQWYCAEIMYPPCLSEGTVVLHVRLLDLGLQMKAPLQTSIRSLFAEGDFVEVYGADDDLQKGFVVVCGSDAGHSQKRSWEYRVKLLSGSEVTVHPRNIRKGSTEDAKQAYNQVSWSEAIKRQRTAQQEEVHTSVPSVADCSGVTLSSGSTITKAWTSMGKFELDSLDPDSSGYATVTPSLHCLCGHSYSVRIRTVNEEGSAPWSPLKQAKTPPACPVGVSQPVIDRICSRGFALRGLSVADDCGGPVGHWMCKVYCLHGNGTVESPIIAESKASTNIQLDGLKPFSRYAVVAYARNQQGCSHGSLPTVVDTPAEIPSTPTGTPFLMQSKLSMPQTLMCLKEVMDSNESNKGITGFQGLVDALERSTVSGKTAKGPLLLLPGIPSELHGSRITCFEFCLMSESRKSDQPAKPDYFKIPPPADFEVSWQSASLSSGNRCLVATARFPTLVLESWEPQTKLVVQYRYLTDSGASPWCGLHSLTTPSVVPERVTSVSVKSRETNSVELNVAVPENNGEIIVGFNAEITPVAEISKISNLSKSLTEKGKLEPGTVLETLDGDSLDKVPQGARRMQYVSVGKSQLESSSITVCLKLKPGSKNVIRLRAVNAIGEGEFSTPIFVETRSSAGPGLPAPERPAVMSTTALRSLVQAHNLAQYMILHSDDSVDEDTRKVESGEVRVVPLSWRIPRKAGIDEENVLIRVYKRSAAGDTCEKTYSMQHFSEYGLLPIESTDESNSFMVRIRLTRDSETSSFSPSCEITDSDLCWFDRRETEWKKDKPQIDSEMLHDSSSRHANHRRGSESLMQEVVEKRPASEKIKIAESKMWKRKQKQKNLLKKIVEHEYFGPVCIMLLATCLFVYWLIKL
eukprot:gb/GECG01015489.1/.p1 GENE.gb/GECG01015489.1/~~gb/GECG01015489.1/.p1  ORF type:complete len:1859 (+),score=202.41 gb/GECG01015489.1/:1-5577(+)